MKPLDLYRYVKEESYRDPFADIGGRCLRLRFMARLKGTPLYKSFIFISNSEVSGPVMEEVAKNSSLRESQKRELVRGITDKLAAMEHDGFIQLPLTESRTCTELGHAEDDSHEHVWVVGFERFFVDDFLPYEPGAGAWMVVKR